VASTSSSARHSLSCEPAAHSRRAAAGPPPGATPFEGFSTNARKPAPAPQRQLPGPRRRGRRAAPSLKRARPREARGRPCQACAGPARCVGRLGLDLHQRRAAPPAQSARSRARQETPPSSARSARRRRTTSTRPSVVRPAPQAGPGAAMEHERVGLPPRGSRRAAPRLLSAISKAIPSPCRCCCGCSQWAPARLRIGTGRRSSGRAPRPSSRRPHRCAPAEPARAQHHRRQRPFDPLRSASSGSEGSTCARRLHPLQRRSDRRAASTSSTTSTLLVQDDGRFSMRDTSSISSRDA